MRAALALGILIVAAPAAAQAPLEVAPPSSGWSERLVGPRARATLTGAAEAAARRDAAATLGRYGEPRRAVETLLHVLGTEADPRVRLAIFDALARRADPTTIAALEELMVGWDADDKHAALRTIGAIGGDAAVRLLVDRLGASEVGDVAVEALVRIGPPAVPRLLHALSIPIAAERAARALGRIGDARATPSLVGRARVAPPDARVATVRALGRIGDPRAVPVLVELLEDTDPRTVHAALEALSGLAGPEQASVVASLADRGTSGQRAAALRALCAIDPVAAAPRVEAAIAEVEAPAVLRSAAIDALLGRPTAPMRRALIALLDDPQHRLAAADGLARIPAGDGVPALLERALADSARALDPALALGLRRHEAELDRDLVERARAHLRADGSRRGLVLGALARDPTLQETLLGGLASADPLDRAHVGLALELLGDRAAALRRSVTEAILVEEDPVAFRSLARAALRVGAPVDPARIDARWWEPSTAVEALWLSAASLADAGPRTRRRTRRAMRRSLRAPRARVRAGAALALALARDRASWRALAAALDDPHDAVRLAAARALEVLAVDAARGAVEARLRVEAEPRVRAALVAAARPGRRPAPALRPGRSMLYARVSTAPGIERGHDFAVEVTLADGRWLRTLALATGEVFVPDVPAGVAELQVALEP